MAEEKLLRSVDEQKRVDSLEFAQLHNLEHDVKKKKKKKIFETQCRENKSTEKWNIYVPL